MNFSLKPSFWKTSVRRTKKTKKIKFSNHQNKCNVCFSLPKQRIGQDRRGAYYCMKGHVFHLCPVCETSAYTMHEYTEHNTDTRKCERGHIYHICPVHWIAVEGKQTIAGQMKRCSCTNIKNILSQK